MPRRSSKPAEDANQAAFRVVRELTGDDEAPRAPKPKKKRKNPAAVALGRLGGKKGGKARAAKLTKERRVEIAREAAAKRWGKKGSR
jgi:hypothetical protein